jgi:copper resistance protein B
MKTLAFSAAIVVAAATPAWSQTMPDMPMGHGAMQHAPAPKPPTPSPPAPAPSPPALVHRHRPAPAPAHVPAPDAETTAPAAEAAPADGAVMDHGAMSDGVMADMSGMATDDPAGTEAAPTPPSDHAADVVFDPATMQVARAQLRREHGGSTITKVMLNLGEYQVRDGEDGYRWEGMARYGGDINRLVLKSEGEGGVRTGVDAAELQVLYSRAITPYFDVQAGIRQDFKPTPQRTYATVGFEGLAPYWFDVQGAAFVSSQGDVLGRLEGTYDLRLTQRFILQPRAEMNLSAQSVPQIGVGSGVSNLELGLRLRYEVRRAFAPYVGVSYDQSFGDTADFARAAGRDPSTTSIVVGLRTWF